MEEGGQHDHDQLISATKALAEKLNFSVDNHKNLKSIKGSDELVRKLKDLFSDFEEHEEKLRLTIYTSNYVFRNLVSLETTMQDVLKFLTDLSNVRSLFFSRTKVKNKLINILHSIRAKNTQLLTSVTLELLSRAKKPDFSDSVAIIETTVEFNLGFAHFHGICRPKNFTIAVEKFKEAARIGDTEAMLMLAECYSEERGLEKDEHMAAQWIDKAAALGCPGAMHRKAMQILKAIEFSNPDKVNRVLCDFDDTYDSGFGDMTLRSELDQSLNTSRGRAMSASPSRRNSTDSRRKGSNERNRDRSTERDIERNMLVTTGASNLQDDLVDRDEEDNEKLQFAMQLLLQAAELDFVSAKTDLGILFELSSDDEKALKWFSLASAGGCPKAMNRLGLLYFHGKGTVQNLERSFSLFLSAARAGDRDANNNAGSCLEQGLGTEMRPAAALVYYLKGAEMDSPQAMFSLGYLLIRSSVKALSDLKMAMEMQATHAYRDDWDRRGDVSTLKERFSSGGNTPPRGTMGSHRGPDGSVKQNLDSSMGIASAAGTASVDITQLLSLEDSGAGKGAGSGPPKKPTKPIRPFSVPHNSVVYSSMPNGKKVISANTAQSNLSKSVNSALQLSMMMSSPHSDPYRSVDTGAKDSLEVQHEKAEGQVKEGVRWLRAAAERGILDARYQLGLVYEQGIGCPPDLHSALSQYEYAAKEGHPKAAMAAGNILYDNLMKEISLTEDPSSIRAYSSITEAKYRKVMDLYRTAAVSGVADAMNCLGLLLEEGRGCSGQRPDIQEAASWYMEACVCGKRDAAVNLALLLSKGVINIVRSLDGTQHYNVAEATHWLEEYKAVTDMPDGLRSQLDTLLYNLGQLGGSAYFNDSYSDRGTPRGHSERIDGSMGIANSYSNFPGRSVLGRGGDGDSESGSEGKEWGRGSVSASVSASARGRSSSRDRMGEMESSRGQERGRGRDVRVNRSYEQRIMH